MLHPLPLRTTHQQTQLQIPLNNPLSNQFNFEQNNRNISNLLLSLTRSRTLPKGLQVHAHIIKTRFQAIPLISHHLINFYSKTQLPLDSQQVFEETQVKSSTTWSSVISCFTQNELPCAAIEFFHQMLGFGVRPDDHIFPSALKASRMLSWREFGRSVHCLALKTGFDGDVFVGSSMVDMYAKCGEIRDARTVFNGMPVCHHGYCLRSLSYVSSLRQDVLLSRDAASDSAYHVMGHIGLWFFKPEEITAIMNDFAEPGTLAPTGLYLGGTKYTVIDPRRSRGCHKRKES
ncbi:hypothetical protein RHSIM_Rhsim03G0016300 [Rhododendron simsii]|uniref:Pentatricopeptide repeat-containing protein n=1 Tax=Rhododendron simsii TaxID=118357 RepID=A0A834HCS4_RHOSS|nr:hypothetical protein RHSIM_Rhsim03G0016300 [Rhododendron simsii]